MISNSCFLETNIKGRKKKKKYIISYKPVLLMKSYLYLLTSIFKHQKDKEKREMSKRTDKKKE